MMAVCLQTPTEQWIVLSSSSNFEVYDFSGNLIGADSLFLLGINNMTTTKLHLRFL